jgi:hypothetical protein
MWPQGITEHRVLMQVTEVLKGAAVRNISLVARTGTADRSIWRDV